jgi:hypothetical protein
MDISSHITVAVKPEFYKSKAKMGAFQPGSTLTLKIIALKGNRALIDFGNFRSTADIKIPVTLGQEVTVKVLESGKQLKLGVIDPGQKNIIPAEASGQGLRAPANDNLTKIQNDFSRILNQVAGSSGGKKLPLSIFNILASLNAYFEPIELKEIISELLPRLKSHFENSGIFFEKSLERAIIQGPGEKDGGVVRNPAELAEVKTIFSRDLKPNLIVLQQFIAENQSLQKIFGTRTLAVMKAAIDNLLSDINQQQGRAVSQLDSAEPFQMFTFTLPLKEENQTARLKVFYEKKQKSESKKDFQISLLLSMDRLGDVRTDLILSEGDLQVTFYVTEPSAKVAIQKNLPELADLLQHFFDRLQLKVNVSEKSVKNFDRAANHTDGNRRVDVRI